MPPAVIVFAKAPVPGRVKTRLGPRLSPDQAAELHSSFVRDTVETLKAVPVGMDLQLHTDETTDAWKLLEVSHFLQASGDLGQRMLHALTAGLAEGRPRVMIVGSDAPTLPAGHIERLLGAEADVALGPSEDGGYYAICCRRVHGKMFAGVEWSGPHALHGTVRASEACGLSVELGEPWYDVDSPADLDRLLRSPDLPHHTAECLGRLGLRPLE